MLALFVPLLTLLLSFLASLASLRYFITRNGRIYWIIPFIISIILFYQNLKTLIDSQGNYSNYTISFETILPFVLSLLWYCMIQAFHFALKTEREYNKFVEESRRTYNEARFINLMEKRRTKKEIEEKKNEANNKPKKITIPLYNFPEEEK